VSALAALAGVVVLTQRADTSPEAGKAVPMLKNEPKTEPFVQAAQIQQQHQIPPKGFDAARAVRVEEIHAHVIAALDDLDPANGIRRVKTPSGEKIVKVPPRFGASRMELHISHNGERYNTGTTRSGSGTSDPNYFVLSAHGKPLTEENLDWPKHERGFGEPMVRDPDPRIEKLRKESEERFRTMQKERLDAVRRLVDRANRGLDSGFETAGAYGWAKPLKLTKTECLPCHAGMKVGDTVGIIAYVHGK
jgi:hypothetical protein